MPLSQEETFLFVLKMALRRALKLVRGLRKQVTDTDEDIMARKLVEDLDIAGWQIVRKPGPAAGFTFEPPEGPGGS